MSTGKRKVWPAVIGAAAAERARRVLRDTCWVVVGASVSASMGSIRKFTKRSSVPSKNLILAITEGVRARAREEKNIINY